MHSVPCKLYTVHRRLNSVHLIQCTVYCTLHYTLQQCPALQCTQHTTDSIPCSFKYPQSGCHRLRHGESHSGGKFGRVWSGEIGEVWGVWGY